MVDDDDWIDLERVSGAGAKPDASVRVSIYRARYGVSPKVRAFIALRGPLADWIRANGPRFRVQIGGPNANKVRIVKDAQNGQFEAVEFKGVFRLSLGIVTAWPNETREPTEAKSTIAGDAIVLTLPDGFAKPGQGEPPPRVAKPLAQPAAAPAFPITTEAPGLKRRVVSAFGDPPAGRSALDKRGA